jgi:hypothetical protein
MQKTENYMGAEKISFEIEIRWATKPGNVKAYADLKINLLEGNLQLHGFSIIAQPGKDPWVGFPAKSGNIPGKFFPVVEADGALKEEIFRAVLDAYRKASKQ